MQSTPKLPFLTLLLLISFASVNAVLFTAALPSIAVYFGISDSTAQQTITWFLVAYALGQLLYGPLANRFGRKRCLYIGISLQILSSALCIWSGMMHNFDLLVLGRLLVALGAGVGLKMTFTLVNEAYEPKRASQTISYLMLAFAITPGLGIALGGFLNSHWGWMSCFYASLSYGAILLAFAIRLPETQTIPDYNALKIRHLLSSYHTQFTNKKLIIGGLILGGSTTIVYVFAAIAPFIAMNILEMKSEDYGLANLLPPIGMILGSLCSVQLTNRLTLATVIQIGISIIMCGTCMMVVLMLMNFSVLYALFLPMVFIYFGIALIIGNASAMSMQGIEDKSHSSAVMSFINVGIASLIVMLLSLCNVQQMLLPMIFLGICAGMFIAFITLKKTVTKS